MTKITSIDEQNPPETHDFVEIERRAKRGENFDLRESKSNLHDRSSRQDDSIQRPILEKIGRTRTKGSFKTSSIRHKIRQPRVKA